MEIWYAYLWKLKTNIFIINKFGLRKWIYYGKLKFFWEHISFFVFVSFWYLSLFWVCLWYPAGITRGEKNSARLLCGTRSSDNIPSVGPYFGNTWVLLGVILHKLAPVARTISWCQWGWTCLHLDKLICKHCRDKNCCSFAVGHIYRSLFQIMAQKAPKYSSCFYMQYLQSFKLTILGHTYRASRLWLTELQTHTLGSYFQ